MNGILVMLSIALMVETFGMVALYNATVNVSHNITEAKSQIEAIGAQNTNLNNTIIAALSSGEVTAMAARDGLVPESKPQYFPVNQMTDPKWPIASHY